MFRKFQSYLDFYNSRLDYLLEQLENENTSERYAAQHIYLAKMQIEQIFSTLNQVRKIRKKSIAEVEQLKNCNLLRADQFGGIRGTAVVSVTKQLKALCSMYNCNIDEAKKYCVRSRSYIDKQDFVQTKIKKSSPIMDLWLLD